MKTVEELQKELDELKEKFEALNGEVENKDEKIEKLTKQNNDFFKEMKDAKTAMNEYKESLEKQDNKKDSKKDSDLQAQLESAIDKIKKLEEMNNETVTKWSQEKLQNAALDVAVKAGAEKHNAENLAQLIKGRLAFDDGVVKVKGDNGQMSIDTLDDLVKEVAGNERYSALITGTKANGGGATNQIIGGAKSENNTITVNEYKQMSIEERNNAYDSGVRIVDE